LPLRSKIQPRQNLHLFKTFASSETVLKVDVTEVGNAVELHQLLK